MAKVIARKPDAHTSDLKSISFKKDDESGFYRKIELDTKCDHLEYKTKKSSKPRISENLYKISDKSNWDYKFEVTGLDNLPHTIYFKELQ